MSKRTIFNLPIRESTTLEFYPNKITLEEFTEFVKQSIDPYYKNLSLPNFPKEMFIEEWFESFMAWCEVEEER